MSTPVLYGSGSFKSVSPHGDAISFNHWGGHASLDNFDHFYGVDDFDGSAHFSQAVEQESQVVCHAQAIEIIQQRLVVLQEMAKHIITERICEVETQTIVFQQFHASVGSFDYDLRRIGGHHVGFDSSIASHFNDITDETGSITTHDFGFSGLDVGGHNWDDFRSPSTVEFAHRAACGAVVSDY